MFDPTTRILIVDDMKTMRKTIGKICKDLGYTDLLEAADGAEAWEQINNAKPLVGLVISDWNMPNSNGLDLLKRIRSDSRFKQLPFIMVTAEAEQTQIVEAVKAKVSDYVVKPFSPDTLREKLDAVHRRYTAAAA